MPIKKFYFVLFLIWFGYLPPSLAQNSFLKDVVLKVDTAVYSRNQNTIYANGEPQLAFTYDNDDEIAEVNLYPVNMAAIYNLSLAASADYDLMDSVVNVNNQYFKVKVKFKNLTAAQFLNFTFSIQDTTTAPPRVEIQKLFPVTNTTVQFARNDTELYVGEEKIFELTTNNLKNIRLQTDWVKSDGLDYRLSESNGLLRLHVMPNALGARTLKLPLQTNKPSLNNYRKPQYLLPLLQKTFTVKASRLKFINIDKKEITADEVTRTKGVEVMIDNNWAINLQKTYRIEDQEQPGGVLIAELFTRNTVTNNRVLCWLRVYNFHRISEGYLYLKDGDQTKFITNFSITPKAAIKNIQVLHEGGDWTSNLTVNPGETINLRIEGEGLHKARFQFDDLTDITSDSSLRTETALIYKLKVPLNIKRKRIGIYNRAAITSYSLIVREYQRPRSFDFISINYGDQTRAVASLLDGPLFYDHVLKDVVFSFNPSIIDQEATLYGRQYLNLDVRVTNSRNELIDQRRIEDIVICPGENSPRYAFYGGKDCLLGDISLNNILGRKTYDLDEWSRLEITIRHDKDKYGDEGIVKKIDLVLRRRTKFDIDVSFPAGLLVKKQGEAGYGDLGGISMAMIAQMSFYHPEKIARYRPYKVGAGFLALNAFNFSSSPDVDRDIGAVIIGALYPTTRDTKLTFPLYLGGGYFISKKTDPWFYFLGPGIRVRF
ncbi:hypothetical protein [Adhaeribacter pallidiroseus]|uniref:Uncharacterized protein n=1 Tax=Adhaeribacter pallidiroseus TaxID=2072847 RepID=A0A369QHU7_9BACT|nr:hypothetical protein [Adhaeribacter pallidiroseus]RDC64461.1 hypothetical protein AHMF7616_03075 [Adhaeribacter pallidiroseus]